MCQYTIRKVSCGSYTASSISSRGIRIIYIGIDVAKDNHDCFIINSEGEVLYDVFTIQNDLEVLKPCTAKSSPLPKI